MGARHDWVFEVLSDLKDYADRHGLPALSAKTRETIAVARAEIDAAEASQRGKGPGGADR